jgi:hypothetical protein
LARGAADNHADAGGSVLEAIRLKLDEVDYHARHQRLDAVDACPHAQYARVVARGHRRRLQRDARKIKIDARRSIHGSRRWDRQLARCFDRDDKRRLAWRHRYRTDGDRGRRLRFGTHHSCAQHHSKRHKYRHPEAYVYANEVSLRGAWLSKTHSAAAGLSVVWIGRLSLSRAVALVGDKAIGAEGAESTQLIVMSVKA